MNNIKSVNKKIEISDINDFSEKYNIMLPEQYIDFLLKYNGGEPEKATFKISDNGESLVNKFYGLGNMKSNLTKVFEALDGELPEGFIAIGNDPGGNEICIGIKSNNMGMVYFWLHDMESHEDMIYLASSFFDFFNNLY